MTHLYVQEVLKEEFKNTTVLTIAHRIETIIDCDRVLVMSEGISNSLCIMFNLSYVFFLLIITMSVLLTLFSYRTIYQVP